MTLRINNNTAASNAYRNLSATDSQMAKSLEKLSSGFRINRAGDDAAGLVISEALRSQVGGLKVAIRNAQDGISLVQTAEGALTEVHAMLQRMRDLAVQASNGTNSADSVAAAQAELAQLVTQIGNIADNTKFNGVSLLKGDIDAGGSGTADVVLQVGANSSETLTVATKNMSKTALGYSNADATTAGIKQTDTDAWGTADVDATIDRIDLTVVATAPGTVTAAGTTKINAAGGALKVIDKAIAQVSEYRGQLGAAQNRLEHTINNLSVTAENLAASESRIRDTDMAAEMTRFTKTQVLVQAGTAMLAQANSAPQNVLQLLRG